MNKQQLASKIWQSANKMRSKIEAHEYKDYILGFIFYKYLSDKEIQYLKTTLKWTDEDLPYATKDTKSDTIKYTIDQCQRDLGYFIEYKNLFSTWLDAKKDFSVADVTDAISDFDNNIYKEEYKDLFTNIFGAIRTAGLSKLGDRASTQTQTIKELFKLIKDIPMDRKLDYDVLGFIYEYLISQFAANAGKKAGEFYTPNEISLVMSHIVAWHLKDLKDIKIYDPTSGSGSLLINIGSCIQRYTNDKDRITYYAQEIKENTYNLTRMNLIMRGIKPSNIKVRNGDTLDTYIWPFIEDNDPRIDAVVSNPPYSQKWNPDNRENDPRYSQYGLAPRSKADFAFLLHDLYHLNEDGIMAIVLPHGVLFRGGEESKIRKNLIEHNKIDAIIGLPANIFFGTGIPTIIMVLKQKRKNMDVLMIDASKGFEKVDDKNKLRASDIKKIIDTIALRKSVDRYAKLVSKDEIRENEYNLNIPRYVDTAQKEESFDIYSMMFGGIPLYEIDEFRAFWEIAPSLKNEIFTSINDSYYSIKDGDIRAIIHNNANVKKFEKDYHTISSRLNSYLYEYLIQGYEKHSIAQAEQDIADEIFKIFDNISLIDKYDAYQILADKWQVISIDLENIKNDGLSVCREIEDIIELKESNGKIVEKTIGIDGKVIPFALIHTHILYDLANSLREKEKMLDEIESNYKDLFESLTEEDKLDIKDQLNNAGDNFSTQAVQRYVKTLKHNDIKKDSLDDKMIQVSKLIDEKKKLNKIIKEKSKELEAKTIETIENLTDEGIKELLESKWIFPLGSDIRSLSYKIFDKLATSIIDLGKKYDDTMSSLDREIVSTQSSLSHMIGDIQAERYDAIGLNELQKLLGDSDESK